MSNNKQSSVEWLAKSYVDLLTELNDDKISLKQFEIRYIEILEQAKAMHKEEVLSFELLLDEHEINALNNNTMLLTREEYYNETFGGKNE